MRRIINFERILCPVGESHEVDEGLKYAIALARSYGASLFVSTCVAESSTIGPDSVAAIRAAINKAVEHSFVASPGLGRATPLAWELIVTESRRPAESIKQQAETLHIDLIVMSSRRHPYAALLGSTAEAVARTAPCPVLVTRFEGRHQASAIGNFEFKKLLLLNRLRTGTSLWTFARSGISVGAALATRFD